MQGLMLAAGMGKRLGKYTNNNTKCMVEIAGKKLIDRAIEALLYAGITKLVIVVGYKGDNLVNYLKDKYTSSQIKFEFIYNNDYDKTNNIYSFYLAKDYICKEDTILMESDLIYDKTLIKYLLDCPKENVAVVAKYKDWMDGTVVTLDNDNFVSEFIEKKDMSIDRLNEYYKTVNVYKLNKEFCKNVYIPFLESYMKAYGMESYYETTLKVIANLGRTKIYGYEISNLPWYEIDNAHDYDVATVLFSSGEEKYKLLASKFGGYWQYDSGILDFCYLVNPFFPTNYMMDRFKKELSTLIGSYPSGLNVINTLAESLFNIDKKYMVIGNGAAELINTLARSFIGKKVAVGLPTFNEYVRCFSGCEILPIDNSKHNYEYSLNEYKSACEKADVLCIVSPDNPSGAVVNEKDLLELLEHSKKNDCTLIIDESFLDFCEEDKYFSLLTNITLENYKNLIVLKSIGKSYGVAGLRLGMLATSNQELLKEIKFNMPVWNINSIAEYFLQIFGIYKSDYRSACNKIIEERNRVTNSLNSIKGIKVYDSQANFVMVDLGNISSKQLCISALENKKIFLKDLSTKDYFEGKNFIRIAIKNKEENDILLDFLKSYIKK